jgi:S-DNA-T family DNA segregation ATPase FtsK/SpoIIIE
LNAIITSLLYKKHPAELKIVLVDPKKVEFTVYNPLINHFLAKVPDEDSDPIITDVTKVVRTLNSLCKLMDTRYDLLKEVGARNIKEYNKKFIERRIPPRGGHGYMPYVVVIIDEFGDLIMTAGKEIELPIARIAQLARAVGIHMVIATQRPTTTIITGNIKANFPARIAFKVSAGIDSKTILDRTGAQQLIGRGDLLALIGGAEPVRVQCAFVDTPEVDEIVKHISKQQRYTEPYQLPEYVGEGGEGEAVAPGSVDMKRLDPMFADVARYVVTKQEGSTSRLQRAFEIGYNRAGKLSDQLEAAGIVGPNKGPKGRDVLIQDLSQLDQVLEDLGVK